jgi:hypothetical protein
LMAVLDAAELMGTNPQPPHRPTYQMQFA